MSNGLKYLIIFWYNSGSENICSQSLKYCSYLGSGSYNIQVQNATLAKPYFSKNYSYSLIIS